MDHAARFKVLRCGRRWGKNILGYNYIGEGIPEGLPMGWFAPSYKLMADAWREFLTMFADAITKISVQEHRLEFYGKASLDFWSLDGPDPARGRKYRRLALDEAGVVPDLESRWSGAIRPTLTDYRGGALILGTPKVNGPYFNTLFNFGAMGEPGWSSFTGRTIDNPHIDPAEIEEARRTMPAWLFAQEYEGQPADSDTAFFSRRIVEAHIEASAAHPAYQGHIQPASERDEIEIIIERLMFERIRFVPEEDRGPWKVWCELPKGRPAQDRPYVMGVDIAAGVGASNTVFSLWDAESRRKIGQYTYPGVTPDVAARFAAMAGLWAGGTLNGRNGVPCALINFENNGAGGELFARELWKFGYPLICRDRTSGIDVAQTHLPKLGWTSTKLGKETLLGDYRGAMARNEIVNPCVESLRECLTYSVDRMGRVVSEQDKPSPDGLARAPHGDMVIADALGYKTCQEARRLVNQHPPAPVHSPKWRMDQAKKAKDREW